MASRDLHGDNLCGKSALLLRLQGPPVAGDRVIVLLAPREAAFGSAAVRQDAHGKTTVRVPEAVPEHAVDQLGVAHAISAAGLGQQIGRGRHVFRAAGHDHVCVAALDGLGGEHHGLQPRAADLVDRGRPHARGNAGRHCGLPGHVLAQPGAEDVPQDHLVDLLRAHARPIQGSAHDRAPQLRGRNGRQRPAETSHGRARGPRQPDFLEHRRHLAAGVP